MTTDPLGTRLQAAAAIAREGGLLAKRHFLGRERLEIELKGHQDMVSIADRAVEDLMRARIGELFPKDEVLGEEGGGDGQADALWIMDPIDGTANFLRGMPYWSLVLAYREGGRTEIGITYDPLHDELFVARRGKGAWRNGEPIRVSACDDPRRACIGLSFNFKQRGEDYVRLIERIVGHGMDHRRMGSSALALCHLADGRIDACLSLHCNSWDVIAGLILVEEAGGVATDYTDGCSLVEPRATAASTPGLRRIVAELAGTPRI